MLWVGAPIIICYQLWGRCKWAEGVVVLEPSKHYYLEKFNTSQLLIGSSWEVGPTDVLTHPEEIYRMLYRMHREFKVLRVISVINNRNRCGIRQHVEFAQLQHSKSQV